MMTVERVQHSGAVIVSALVNWEGVKWVESRKIEREGE